MNRSEDNPQVNYNSDLGLPSYKKKTYNPELLEQLYKGEKARNKVMEKQVKDLKMEMATFNEELKLADDIKKEAKEYQSVILKYDQ